MKIEEIEVELKPHKGMVQTAVGVVEHVLPQSVIFVNGKWAGYVGDEPGSHISIILTGLPDAVLQEIKRKVDELRGHASSAITQAKEVRESAVTAEDVAKEVKLSEVGL